MSLNGNLVCCSNTIGSESTNLTDDDGLEPTVKKKRTSYESVSLPEGNIISIAHLRSYPIAFVHLVTSSCNLGQVEYLTIKLCASQ